MDPIKPDNLAVIKFIIRHLPSTNSNGVEFYAREGDWFTRDIARQISQIELWEIDPAFSKALKSNIPSATVRIVDSIEYSLECKQRFDLISLDNPQGIYGNNYCEHFEALPRALKLLKPQGLVLFNINLEPYRGENLGKSYDDWIERRHNFYQSKDPRLSKEFFIKFYSEFFLSHGYEAKEIEVHMMPSKIKGHPDFIGRFCTFLTCR